MTDGRPSRVEAAAIDLLSRSTGPQIDALCLRLGLSSASGDMLRATRISALWDAARKSGGTALADLEGFVREQQGKSSPVFWLYVSRANADRDDPGCQTFFDQLAGKLQASGVCPAGDPRYLDMMNLQEPGVWSPWSLRAIAECRILICLYSKAYFDDPYCGQVCGAFLERLRSQIGYQLTSGTAPPLIIPILWGPPEDYPEILPRAVRNIPTQGLAYGREYREKGLRFIQAQARARRDDYERLYEDTLDRLTDRIATETLQNPLLSGFNVPALKDLPNVFRQLPGASKPDNRGSYAKFIFFAATRQEIAALREDSESYGDEPKQWRPYYPQSNEAVEFTTAKVAIHAGMTPDVIPLDSHFSASLNAAFANRDAIIVVADPWSLHWGGTYLNCADAYDKAALPGSRLLVCRNAQDKETDSQWAILTKKLSKVFERKYRLEPSQTLGAEITSVGQFREELENAILAAHTEILDQADHPKVAAGFSFVRPGTLAVQSSSNEPVPDVVRSAESDRVDAIPKPRLQSPVGGAGE